MLHMAMENWSQEEKVNHRGSEAALEPRSKILGLPAQPSADPQLVFYSSYVHGGKQHSKCQR